jgi:hypothetical protein
MTGRRGGRPLVPAYLATGGQTRPSHDCLERLSVLTGLVRVYGPDSAEPEGDTGPRRPGDPGDGRRACGTGPAHQEGRTPDAAVPGARAPAGPPEGRGPAPTAATAAVTRPGGPGRPVSGGRFLPAAGGEPRLGPPAPEDTHVPLPPGQPGRARPPEPPGPPPPLPRRRSARPPQPDAAGPAGGAGPADPAGPQVPPELPAAQYALLDTLDGGSLTLMETAALLELPVSAVRVLAARLIDLGLVGSRPPVPYAAKPDQDLLERVADGLRALKL